MLKPQDVVVALKVATLAGVPWTYAGLGTALGMSASGVHESAQRAVESGLLTPDARRCVRSALVEFLVHGAKYAFPPKRGAIARGVPTGASAQPLADRLASRDSIPLVWPDRVGTSLLPTSPHPSAAAPLPERVTGL